jgi:predicted dehydrogenase
VVSIRSDIGQYLPSWRPEKDYRVGVSARRALGGGVLLELSHEIDYLRWIFGDIDWVRAILSRQSNLEIDVEDTAHLVLGFRDAADGRKIIANLNMDFVRRDTTRQCLSIGELGSLRWDGLSGSVDFFPAGANEWRSVFAHPPQRDESYIAEWEHFLSCICDGEIPMVDGYDGLAALNIIEAARHSADNLNTAPVVAIGKMV